MQGTVPQYAVVVLLTAFIVCVCVCVGGRGLQFLYKFSSLLHSVVYVRNSAYRLSLYLTINKYSFGPNVTLKRERERRNERNVEDAVGTGCNERHCIYCYRSDLLPRKFPCCVRSCFW